ncbi:oocyte zinc finger protein XlCOF7.1-like isoform X2 [Bufo gargarizans]|nr:oocyte zinc finger protein XlCOF7.1-like isoform X2 [Bufo gargarizans]XP_044153734.1 oocyte zinc finger protein XlCOF7.1-like isoform X2 [Bufo gargarizans]
MDKERSYMTERILNLTLEIIYLLTGEDYAPVRKTCNDVKDSLQPCILGKLSKTKSTINELPNPSLIRDELKNDEKILDLTNKIIELLTGEVPIRYEDITVCFTIDEWEYVERHAGCYKDILKENQEPLVPADNYSDGDRNEKNNGKCDGQNQSIKPNTYKPVASLALDFSSHIKGTTVDPVSETSPQQTKCESSHIEEETTIDDPRHLESETYASSQPTVSECSQMGEESIFNEDVNYQVSCFFTTAEQKACEYLYITEDGNTHVSSNKLAIMTCSDCSDRFTVESDDARFPRLHPYRCRKCSKCISGTDAREVPKVAIAELPRTSNLVYEDYVKRNLDHKKCFASRKHFDNKKINRKKKACSYSKWGGYSEDTASLESYNLLPEEEKMFICSHCGKCFNHGASLELHLKTHTVEKASFMSQSGKYLRNKALKVHQAHQLIHTGGKQYNCSECGKSFKRSLSLVEHMQLHTGEKTFTCLDCGQSFTQRSAYVTHYKVHQAGKLHFCFECGKSFRTKADLTTHQRIHMGETPFPCPECGENFTRRANLVRHQRIHTGEKPFSCPDCGKCFTRKLGLMKHQKIHSGEKVYKKGYRKNAFSMYRVVV